jgi:hypothetical protein
MSRDLELDEPWILPQPNRDLFDPVEEVTVISAAAAAARPAPDTPANTEVATLRHVVNADELHEQRVNALRTALNAAMDFLTLPKTGAKAWASDLRYGDGVIDHVEEAADRVMAALNLISIHEEG